MGLLKQIESSFYAVREFMWKYPDNLIFDQNSLWNLFRFLYRKSRPFSHIFSSLTAYLLIVIFLFSSNSNGFVSLVHNEFFEGTVVGTDENGNLLGITRINPLVHTTIQLENDISQLIYESLLDVRPNGEISPVLIDGSPEEIKKGNHYKFRLKQGIIWHDGSEMTTEDVKATFAMMKNLNSSNETSTNYSSVVANQLSEIVIDSKYEFEIKLKSEDAVLPTFFESISFKILPAKYLKDVNPGNILTSRPKINTFPVGTGPYKFGSATKSTINLVANDSYYAGKPKIQKIVFKLFRDKKSAINALKTGQVHALAGVFDEDMKDFVETNKFTAYKSNVIYSQYWALYFNLGNTSKRNLFLDKQIRKAIGLAINRGEIIENLFWDGEEAYGPIPKNSFAFDQDLPKERQYDPNQAKEILNNAGWVYNPEKNVREKDGEILQSEIVYINSDDRERIAKVIKNNLEGIGVRILLRPETIDTINNKYILPDTKPFQMLFYGQTTFIDPDRFELFHSSQKFFPQGGGQNIDSSGLNITGYSSDAQGSRIDPEKKELYKVSKSDILLEDGRSMIDPEKRREKYVEFQELLEDDMPVVFLYHPIYPYVVSNRVKGIQLENMNNLEDRYINVVNWSIEV